MKSPFYIMAERGLYNADLTNAQNLRMAERAESKEHFTAEVAFGQTAHSRWPDAFRAGSLWVFRIQLIKVFAANNVSGVEWHPVDISANRNRRLLKATQPDYRWARITGRILATPYYSRVSDTGKRDGDGKMIVSTSPVPEPVELDASGCNVLNRRIELSLRHRIRCDTWDGKDMVEVIPTGIYPTELVSERCYLLLKQLKVVNIVLFPLREGSGL